MVCASCSRLQLERLSSQPGNISENELDRWEEEQSVLSSDWSLKAQRFDASILDKPACVRGTPFVLAAFCQQHPLLVAEGPLSTPLTSSASPVSEQEPDANLI